jgi:inner membrane transporter RhtA
MLHPPQTSALLQRARRVGLASMVYPLEGVRAAANAVPPTGLALLSILSVQVGAALAKDLFPALGASGTVFLRIAIAALVLLAVQRPRLRGYARADYRPVILFGLVIAVMNTAFYLALARLPLGIAVTVEFVGPLGVAVAGSRRGRDLLWGGLAAAGIILLAPLPTGQAALDPLGVALALLTGAGWAGYIVLNVRVGRAFPGNAGLALAMAVAALMVLPLGVQSGGAILGHPSLLLAGAGVALLSTAIPFSLEHAALKRLPAHVFGVLMSVEPAVGALVGVVLLGETLGMRGLLAIACVSLATGGSARVGRTGTPP